jgi:PilZ domain
MSPEGADRRAGPRHFHRDEHRIVSIRVRPGHTVDILDVAAGGVLVESGYRLIPGALVELRLQPEDHPPVFVRGRVLRCSVTRLRANGVSYRGAIAFQQYRWRF